MLCITGGANNRLDDEVNNIPDVEALGDEYDFESESFSAMSRLGSFTLGSCGCPKMPANSIERKRLEAGILLQLKTLVESQTIVKILGFGCAGLLSELRVLKACSLLPFEEIHFCGIDPHPVDGLYCALATAKRNSLNKKSAKQ